MRILARMTPLLQSDAIDENSFAIAQPTAARRQFFVALAVLGLFGVLTLFLAIMR